MRNKLILFLILLVPLAGHTQNFDLNLLKKLNVNRNKDLDGMFLFITNSAGPVVFGVPAGMVVGGLLDHNKNLLNNGLELCATTLVNGAITYSMKRIIHRQRPFADPVTTERNYAFPSGHTSSTFALATTLSMQYPKWYIIVPSYLYASLVGYSRIHIGVHYPTDVLGGMIVGSGSAVLTKWLRKKWETKQKPVLKTVLLY